MLIHIQHAPFWVVKNRFGLKLVQSPHSHFSLYDNQLCCFLSHQFLLLLYCGCVFITHGCYLLRCLDFI